MMPLHATTLKEKGKIHYLQVGVFFAILLFPAGSFLLSKSMTSSFYLLLVCSFTGIACGIRLHGKNFGQLLIQYWPMSLAMASLLIATLISQLLSAQFSISVLVLPLQLACFPFLFWILLVLSEKHFRHFHWGFSIGAIYFASALYIYTDGGAERPTYVLGVPINIFGDFTLLLGFLALFSITRTTRFMKAEVTLKSLAAISALYATYLAQTRGGWIAIPLFIAIAFYLWSGVRRTHRIIGFLLVVPLLCSTYFINDKVRTRIDAVKSDLQHYLDGTDKDTSIGLRLQIWEGSWVLFAENPITGIGRKQYPKNIDQMVERKIMSQSAAMQPHSHNDFLFQMVEVGIFGFLAMLSVYFVPAYYFLRKIHSHDPEVRMIVGMGLALTMGFFIYGLSETLFNFRITYMFYVTLLAILFAFLEKRNLEHMSSKF